MGSVFTNLVPFSLFLLLLVPSLPNTMSGAGSKPPDKTNVPVRTLFTDRVPIPDHFRPSVQLLTTEYREAPIVLPDLPPGVPPAWVPSTIVEFPEPNIPGVSSADSPAPDVPYTALGPPYWSTASFTQLVDDELTINGHLVLCTMRFNSIPSFIGCLKRVEPSHSLILRWNIMQAEQVRTGTGAGLP